MDANRAEITLISDNGYRQLAAAILLRAAKDAMLGSLDAWQWLQSSDAERLADPLGFGVPLRISRLTRGEKVNGGGLGLVAAALAEHPDATLDDLTGMTGLKRDTVCGYRARLRAEGRLNNLEDT